ncbi:MAG: hypothetical protein WD425_02160 [Nitrospirales bacterium]
MKKKPILRIKIMSMVSGTFIVYQLPVTVQLDSVRFDLNEDGPLVRMDDGGFAMAVSEALHKKEQHEQI